MSRSPRSGNSSRSRRSESVRADIGQGIGRPLIALFADSGRSRGVLVEGVEQPNRQVRRVFVQQAVHVGVWLRSSTRNTVAGACRGSTLGPISEMGFHGASDSAPRSITGVMELKPVGGM